MLQHIHKDTNVILFHTSKNDITHIITEKYIFTS